MKIPQKNSLEWTVFGMGALLLVAVVGYLIYDVVSTRSGAPHLAVAIESPERTPAGFAVGLTVANQGGTTAEAVTLSVTLMRGGREIERADLEIAFLPRGSRRRAWAHFRHDPATGTVEAVVTGFRASAD